MSYRTKENLLVFISIVIAAISVLGLSFITAKKTGQWLSLVFFLYGYSILWWGTIDQEIGTVNSMYSRFYSKIGDKMYTISIVGSLVIGIGISSSNKISSFLLIAVIHLTVTLVFVIAYIGVTGKIEDIRSDETIRVE